MRPRALAVSITSQADHASISNNFRPVYHAASKAGWAAAIKPIALRLDEAPMPARSDGVTPPISCWNQEP